MKAAGHWPCAERTKNKTKALDRNLSSTLIRPHQGQSERERVQEREKGEREKWEKRRHRRARPKKDKIENS